MFELKWVCCSIPRELLIGYIPRRGRGRGRLYCGHTHPRVSVGQLFDYEIVLGRQCVNNTSVIAVCERGGRRPLRNSVLGFRELGRQNETMASPRPTCLLSPGHKRDAYPSPDLTLAPLPCGPRARSRVAAQNTTIRFQQRCVCVRVCVCVCVCVCARAVFAFVGVCRRCLTLTLTPNP